jgi:hypothetical protein
LPIKHLGEKREEKVLWAENDLVEDIEEEDDKYIITYIVDLYMLSNANEISLEKYVQKWVLVDNQIQILQEKMKTMREWKKKLTENVMVQMEEKGISHKILSIPDGELSVQEKREYSSLSYGFIEECLTEIIPEKETVEYIMDYMREHREIKIVKEIRRKNILSTK